MINVLLNFLERKDPPLRQFTNYLKIPRQ